MNLPMTVVPQHFKDDLAKRIFPIRFRHIGNPYAFLNEVGIVPILEYIYKGNLLIDVAEALNVSLTILNTWVEREGHGAVIEEAEQISAEGYLAEGQRKLREATNSFELAKAREMVKQAQFLASKKNKRKYGSSDANTQGAGVSYIFNIGGEVSAPTLKTVESIVDRTLPDDTAPISLDLMQQLQLAEPFDQNTPIGAIDWANKPVPAKPLVNLSHLTGEPEIGPFYDAEAPKDDV